MSQIMLSRLLRAARTPLALRQSLACVHSSAVLGSASGNEFSSLETTKKYFQRHQERSSPLSPYTTYQPQLTWLLSITHRLTGIGLGVLVYGIGYAELMAPGSSFEQILASINATFPGSLLTAVKVLAGTSLAFHTFNGVRHLAWDSGRGFQLKRLYATGYAVLGLTLATLAFLLVSD